MITTNDIIQRTVERYDDIYEIAEVLGVTDFDDETDVEVFIYYHKNKVLRKKQELDIW